MKIPIHLITHDRPLLLEKVLIRLLKYTDWDKFELWILDNNSTIQNKKVISMFVANNTHIRVFESSFNQIAYIQNELIKKSKADIYIKIDDDILVTEGWANALLGVYQRNKEKMCFGSVVIPINGFGWIPFLDIMDLREEYQKTFPSTQLRQDCMGVAVHDNDEACRFIWQKCLKMDNITKIFKQKQNNTYQDLICPHRYSIGAIIYSHSTWEKMGGWKVEEGFAIRKYVFNQIVSLLRSLFINRYNAKSKSRFLQILEIALSLHKTTLGIEEEEIFRYSQKSGTGIYITTEGLLFHFSFARTEQYLMNYVYPNIIF